MSKARKCDICGKLYESYNVKNDSKKPNSLQFISRDIDDSTYRYNVIDCCPKCMESIKDNIDYLKRMRGPVLEE